MLAQHFQCKLAEDYIMVGSADLGQPRAGRGEGSSESNFEFLSPANTSRLGRNASLRVGFRIQAGMEGTTSPGFRFGSRICVSDL